jgi:phosphoribosyl 1,2-cyclic phosphate phosphodiesterase
MDLIFLGTGAAWSLPELNCDCVICREMRRKGERRRRAAFLLSGKSNLLVDCGPDIASQLSRHQIDRLDAVLITHEHGDHYMGLDELFAYKRTCAKGEFDPIRVYMTRKSWEVVRDRFGYLAEMGVITVQEIEPGSDYAVGEFAFVPFKTNHGGFALGSVGFIIKTRSRGGKEVRLVYTSDFEDLPETHPDLTHPDYLIIQSFWLNEPIVNRPHHMSFQRALEFIEAWKPEVETFLVHMGDGEMVPGDPANRMSKKSKAADPLKDSKSGAPYPVPLNQEQWQKTIDQIGLDRRLPFKITVAHDDLRIQF